MEGWGIERGPGGLEMECFHRRILVVDDSAAIRHLMRTILAEEGFEVKEPDHIRALKSAQMTRPKASRSSVPADPSDWVRWRTRRSR